jgi:uncharacterized protein involved in exopolysaccharide biosynthesis
MSEELSLRDLYLVLKKHRLWLVFTPLATGLLTLVFMLFIAKPEYRSSTTLNVQTTLLQSRLEDRIVTSDAPVLNRDQIEAIALSRPILEGVLKSQPEDERAKDAATLAESLKVKFITQPSTTSRVLATIAPLVSLEARAGSARLAADTANAWAQLTLKTLNELPGLRVTDSINTLEKQVLTARASLGEAEKQVQAFTVSTTLALDQASLAAAIEERSALNGKLSDATAALETAQTELAVRRDELRAAQSSVDFTAGAEATGLAASGTSLTEVNANLQRALTEAQRRFNVAAEAQRVFNTTDDRSLLRGKLGAAEARLVQINSTLQSFDSRLKTTQARLAETRRQIADQPRLLTLEREITADPAIAAAIQQNNQNLGDLVGLKLQNQELNPLYQSLLTSSVQLQSDLNTMTAERDAITAEQTRLTQQVNTDRARVAQLDANARKLEIDLSNSQGVYQAAQARVNRLSGMSLGDRTLGGDQPEYLRLRGLVSDLEANRSKLSVNLESLQTRASGLDTRIATLKQRVGDQTLRSSRLTQTLETYREQLKILSQKLTDLQIERASAGNLAQVLLPAFPPTRKANGAALPVALAIVVGLLIGLIMPFILEALRDPNQKVLTRGDNTSSGFVSASAD